MALITMVFQNCGGLLTVPENTDRFFCTHCSSQLPLDNGHIPFRADINDAHMSKLDFQECVKQFHDEEQLRHESARWWRALLLSSVIGALVLFGSVVLGERYQCRRLMYLCAVIDGHFMLLLPFLLAAFTPRKWVEKNGWLVRIGLFIFVLAFELLLLIIAASIFSPFLDAFMDSVRDKMIV